MLYKVSYHLKKQLEKQFVRRLKKKYKNLILNTNVRIERGVSVNLRTDSTVVIGKNVLLRSQQLGYHAGMPFPTTLLLDGEKSTVRIGDNCRINGCYIHAKNSIIIGNNCVIASGTNIIDSNGHIVASLDRTIGRDKPKPIVIHDNVWIGLNSLILKGTEIGENSIVSAGSVVKGKFPDNVIIGGNPAVVQNVIKYDSNT